MGAADPQTTVSHGDHDIQIRICHFQTGCISQSPSVQSMKRMRIEKSVKKPRTTNAESADLHPKTMT